MKVDEVLISHGRSRRTASRKGGRSYYNGVLFCRTPISCVVLSFLALFCGLSLEAAITFPLSPKWTAKLPSPPAFPPAFDDEYAYAPLRDKQLVALMLKDGTTAWSVECPMTAAPAAGDALVFAGSDGMIEARARNDGDMRWQRPIEGRVISVHWDAGWLL